MREFTSACWMIKPLVEAQGCVGCFASIAVNFAQTEKLGRWYICESSEEMRSIMSDNTTNQVIDRVNLTIIARNTAPKREELYPCTWMLFSGGLAIRLHVAHDFASHPYIEDRCAA
jgi:hypothetical protein